MDKLTHISNVIQQYTTCKKQGLAHCNQCVSKIKQKIRPLIDADAPISFILPAFPAKSSSRSKTLSPLPDLGEALALKHLNQFCQHIVDDYSPGANLIICADGHVFNDVVGVTDSHVDSYQRILRQCQMKLNLTYLQFFELSDAYHSNDYQQIRSKLVDEFGQAITLIKKNRRKNKDEHLTFCGIHRFLYEDLQYHFKTLSKNKIKMLAKERAYQTIQRSHAWSECLKHKFPNHLRLSIHPHHCESEKLSIQLLKGQDRWATPWHNVVLKKGNQFSLIHRNEAIRLGAKLTQSKTPWERHYALESA